MQTTVLRNFSLNSISDVIFKRRLNMLQMSDKGGDRGQKRDRGKGWNNRDVEKGGRTRL